MNIFDVQKALAAKGYDPGAIDGVWGRRTSAAVKAFQRDKGLQVDGIVGPITRKALLGEAAKPDSRLDDVSLVWIQEAWRLLGVTERPGAGSNEAIIDWAGDLGIPYKSDDIPWCGLFVAHCIGSTLTTEPLPVSPLGAKNWARFGAPCTAQPGAVAVFWRVSPTNGKGHVGFYVGEDDEAVHVLGGNQSDKVSVARVAKNRLVGYRWPATVPMGTGGPLKVDRKGKISTKES